jgi:NTE family protein
MDDGQEKAGDLHAVLEPASVHAVLDDKKQDFLGGEKLEEGLGLCLSGGGFRAMFFHLGAFIRLNECGLLATVDRVSSVSGGSLAAGALAVNWNSLGFDKQGVAQHLVQEVGLPILALARCWVDVPGIVLGLLPFVTASGRAAAVYDKKLFQGRTLQDLPDKPRFTFTATSLQSGVLWRFAREYAADWRVGYWDKPDLPLAKVAAASAAFPPFMSPAYINVPPGRIQMQAGADLCREPFTTHLRLTDGGVYDNMGLEPIWKRYRTVLVSDGGLVTPPDTKPRAHWLSQSLRVTNISLQEGINMRRRVLTGLERIDQRAVIYWGIGQDVDSYKIGNPLNFSSKETGVAAAVKTRLKRFPKDVRTAVLRAGYAHADAALTASGITVPVTAPPTFGNLPDVDS